MFASHLSCAETKAKEIHECIPIVSDDAIISVALQYHEWFAKLCVHWFSMAFDLISIHLFFCNS